jgi:RNase P subunit RPR2
MTDLCEYGCNQPAMYTFKNGKKCCSKSFSGCPTSRKKIGEGIKKAYKDGKCYTNYTQDIKDKISKSVKNTKDIEWIKTKQTKSIDEMGKRQQIRFLSEEQNGKCKSCGLDMWQDKKITLELHHDKDDMVLLCPNCHSQTPNWRRKKYIETQNMVECLV